MDHGVQINWEPLLWVAGIVVMIISGLVALVIYFIKRQGELIIDVQTHHSREITDNQLAIKEIATRQEESFKQTDKRITMIEKKVFKL